MPSIPTPINKPRDKNNPTRVAEQRQAPFIPKPLFPAVSQPHAAHRAKPELAAAFAQRAVDALAPSSAASKPSAAAARMEGIPRRPPLPHTAAQASHAAGPPPKKATVKTSGQGGPGETPTNPTSSSFAAEAQQMSAQAAEIVSEIHNREQQRQVARSTSAATNLSLIHI